MDEDNVSDEQNKQPETNQPTKIAVSSDENPVPSLDDDLKDQDSQSKAGDPTKPSPSSLDRKNLQKQPMNKKKLLIVGLVILLIAGAAYWWFFAKDKNSKTTSQPSQTSQQLQSTNNSLTPNTVVYAFRAKDSDPFVVYWRPAEGGSRTDALKLEKGDILDSYDVEGAKVVFATKSGIYLSTDSGKSYKIVTIINNSNPQTAVTSLKFSTEGNNIVYALLDGVSSKNTVKSINLDGTGSKDLFVGASGGVFLQRYSAKQQKIIYREGCYYCDGTPALPVERDLKTGSITKLMSTANAGEITDLATSDDLSTIVYAESTTVPSEDGPGPSFFAPITIFKLDVASNKISKVTTFGSAGEKNANGSLKTHQIIVGFLTGTNNPYYTNDNSLYTVNSTSNSLTYQATKELLYVSFVGDNNVIAGSGASTSEFILSNYDTTNKKSATIFTGDNNTILFGVTTR